jgi:hypothetical protein
VFLVNSRYPRFSATSSSSGREVHHHQRHTFSRSYGVNLPSSLARVLPSALEYSSHPPESVYGTVSTAFDPREDFPGSIGSPSFAPEGTPHHLSALNLRLWPLPPTDSAYWLEPESVIRLGYLPSSLLAETSVLVQEYSPASHRLRISASP